MATIWLTFTVVKAVGSDLVAIQGSQFMYISLYLTYTRIQQAVVFHKIAPYDIYNLFNYKYYYGSKVNCIGYIVIGAPAHVLLPEGCILMIHCVVMLII